MAYNSPVASTTKYGVVEIGTGINVTNGVISVPPNGQVNTTVVEDADSPYTVTSTDYYVGVNGAGAGVIINLPVGVDGRELVIKSEAGQTSNITINPNGVQTVENAASYSILAATDGSVTLIFRDTNWNAV
jgi:hypothetical protein